jgi:hypothetical protein
MTEYSEIMKQILDRYESARLAFNNVCCGALWSWSYLGQLLGKLEELSFAIDKSLEQPEKGSWLEQKDVSKLCFNCRYFGVFGNRVLSYHDQDAISLCPIKNSFTMASRKACENFVERATNEKRIPTFEEERLSNLIDEAILEVVKVNSYAKAKKEAAVLERLERIGGTISTMRYLIGKVVKE